MSLGGQSPVQILSPITMVFFFFFSVLTVLSFMECNVHGIIWNGTFHVWLLLLNIVLWRLIPVVISTSLFKLLTCSTLS